MNINHLAIHADDVPRMLAFYESIGLQPFIRSDDYARLRCPVGDTTLSLIRTPEASPAGRHLTLYIETEDLPGEVRRLKEEGLSFEHDCLIQPWGWQEARLLDPAGNIVCLFHAGARRFSA